jgi:predicted TIM-barrel fold metal-dependent hydrolase
LGLCSFPLAVGALTYDSALATRLQGRILLQVESHGEAWYIRAKDLKRYYMKDGAAAYSIMRFFSLGITDADLAKIPQVANTIEMKAASSACASSSLGNRFRGQILLQVQQHGEAWYVDPVKCRAIYMKDGAVAYEVMRFLGFGVFTRDLEKIQDGGAVVGSGSNANPPAAQPPAATSTPDISCASPTDTSHMDIFDSHVHITPKVSAAQIISEMNKASASVANLYSGTLETAAQYPGRFITFVDTPDSPQPSTWLTQGQTFVTSAEAKLKTGKYYGVGEANLRYYTGNGGAIIPPPTIYVAPDTPLWLQLVDLSARYHVPISFHFIPDDAVANAAFERMLSHNKNAIFIWAHLGFNNMTLNSATLNDFLLRHPNLYFDTAGIQNMQNTPPQPNSNWARLADQSDNGRLKEEWRQFFETWNSRILFGSDAGGGANSLDRWLNYTDDISDFAPADAVGHWRSLLSYLDYNSARNILSSNSRALFLKEQKPVYAYSVASGSACHSISVRSDSSISALTFNPSTRVISFTAADSSGTTGSAVITIPTALVGGTLKAAVDGQSVTSQTTSNSTNTTVSLDFAGGIRTITLSAP